MSIRDVAGRAGVSPTTVSRVFTRPDAVAVETRQRVLAAASELHYAPHPVARSLAQRRTGNLGIVVPDIANSFSAVITKAVQHEARRDGYALFVAASEDLATDEERWARALAPRVDGLLLLSPRMPDESLRQLAEMTALVVVNRLLDGIPAVLTDPYTATCHAVEHLDALGHRDVAYLAGPDGYSNHARLRGFRDSCARLGLTPIELGPFDAQYSAGVRAGDLVLATAATAVLAYNDEVAVGVLNRLADRGVRVPDDVSVVGFDGARLAEMVRPRLTTVRIPAAAAGAAAVDLVLGLLAGSDEGREPRTLAAELIVRSSSGRAPRTVAEPEVATAGALDGGRA